MPIEPWRDPSVPSRPRRGAHRADDGRGEDRPALRRVGRRIGRRRRRRPAPARHERRRRPRRAAAVGPRPAHASVRHAPRSIRPSARSRSLRTQERIVAANAASASPPSPTRSASPASPTWGATAYPVPLSLGSDLRPGARRARWRAASATTCAASACTRASPPCSTSCATRAGAASRRRSARTRYLVGTIATAYVRGLESAGVVATLKHFVGYSASKAGRNLAPGLDRAARARRRAAAAVRDGDPRERRALGHELLHRHRRRPVGRRRAAADRAPPRHVGLRGHGRRRLLLDRVPASCCTASRATWTDAAGAALAAGIDVELPTVKTFGETCVARRRGRRGRRGAHRPRRCGACCARRWSSGCSTPTGRRSPRRSPGATSATPMPLRGSVDLDPAEQSRRSRAGWPRRRSCCCATTASCRCAQPAPHRRHRPDRRRPLRRARLLLVPGPRRRAAPRRRRWASSCRRCARRCGREFPDAEIVHARGTTHRRRRDGRHRRSRRARRGRRRRRARPRRPRRPLRPRHERRGLRRRVARAARRAAGRSLDAVLDAGRRPSVDAARRSAVRARARRGATPPRIVQTFFPGEEGTGAIAGVLSGRVNPSGRLPVSVPRTPGRAAVDLSRLAARAAQRRVEHRPDRGVRVRSRPRLHDVRVDCRRRLDARR